ncbi:MAG: hypothetical protein G01um101470_775, partial [Parcubacteria group bacterium Gr01-1014_70]
TDQAFVALESSIELLTKRNLLTLEEATELLRILEQIKMNVVG